VSLPVQCVQAFLLQVGGDRLSTAMFQLAICGGSLAVPQDLVARKQPANAAAKPATHEPAVALPSEGQPCHFIIIIIIILIIILLIHTVHNPAHHAIQPTDYLNAVVC